MFFFISVYYRVGLGFNRFLRSERRQKCKVKKCKNGNEWQMKYRRELEVLILIWVVFMVCQFMAENASSGAAFDFHLPIFFWGEFRRFGGL